MKIKSIKTVSYLTFLYAVLFLTVVFPVSAEDDIKVKRESRRQNLPVQTQATLEIRRRRIQRIYNQIKNELSKRHQNLLIFKTQIDNRIIKLEAKGKNLTLAKTKLTEFSALDSAYNADLATFDGQIQAVLQSNQPADQVPALKTAAAKVRSDLQLIKKFLNDVFRLANKS